MIGREGECGFCMYESYDTRLAWMTEQGKFLWRRRWHSIHVSIVCRRREWGMRDGWWMARNQLTPSYQPNRVWPVWLWHRGGRMRVG